MRKLVIVESPTKAKTIKSILGKSYTVIATFGHLYDLPPKSFGFDPETFEPRYVAVKGKRKVIKRIKDEIKKSDEVIIASDPDREGEMIAFHIYSILQKTQPSTPYTRIRFKAITSKEIKRSISNPDTINQNLVNSQKARRILDRIVGYKISPVLWRRFKEKGLSAGRVQSAVLKFICDREKEIETFKPDVYYTVVVHFEKDGVKFKGSVVNSKGQEKKFRSQEAAKRTADEIKKGTGKIADIKIKIQKVSSPPPLKTSTLQQEAYSKFKIQPEKAMKIAQSLYEGKSIAGKFTGLITYHRTDSVRISKEAMEEAENFIRKTCGENYSEKRNFKNRTNTQDAHECIRPVSVKLLPEKIKPYLEESEYRLYKIIWERFLTSQMAPAEDETRTIIIELKGEKVKVIGKKEVFDGWRKIAKTKKTELELPELELGEPLPPQKVEVKKTKTKPPERYTFSTLVKKMETTGVGRPSTYAQTIKTLKKRKYIKVEKGKIVPTEIGKMVNDYLQKHYGKYLNEKFTAYMESELDRIEQGKMDWKSILKSVFESLSG